LWKDVVTGRPCNKTSRGNPQLTETTFMFDPARAGDNGFLRFDSLRRLVASTFLPSPAAAQYNSTASRYTVNPSCALRGWHAPTSAER
jgi:hypothetical protein